MPTRLEAMSFLHACTMTIKSSITAVPRVMTRISLRLRCRMILPREKSPSASILALLAHVPVPESCRKTRVVCRRHTYDWLSLIALSVASYRRNISSLVSRWKSRVDGFRRPSKHVNDILRRGSAGGAAILFFAALLIENRPLIAPAISIVEKIIMPRR